MRRFDGNITTVRPADLQHRLQASLAVATKAEAAIANHMLTNLQSLPFETAASVAQKIGVSEASIGRYCRGIGFQHFRALKAELQADLGDKAWLIGDRLRDFHQRSTSGKTEAARALELELAAIVAVHEMTAGPQFAACVARLATRATGRTAKQQRLSIIHPPHGSDRHGTRWFASLVGR